MDLSERPGGEAPRQPWETVRFRHVHRILTEGGVLGGPVDLLDVGAGDAWLAGQLAGRLEPGSSVMCWDIAYSDADLAALPVGVVGTRVAPEGRRFDALLLLDVLEHVDEDLGLLRQCVSDLLRPGGHALITVPAWPALWSNHDTALDHMRRYRPADARKLVHRSGLRIRRSGGLFGSLIGVRAAQVLGERVRPRRVDRPRPLVWRGGAASGAAVSWALRVDARLSREASRYGAALPGLSWWALCEKPDV